MLEGYSELGDARIGIRYVEGEGSFAERAFAALDAKLPALTSYFEVSEPFLPIRVVLVPSRDEFDRLVRELLRVEIEVPSHPARIAQPQRTDMVVLSPSAYEKHSAFDYVPAEFDRLLVHEAVHMVEEFLSPDIEASPGWWGEGLAVHLSGQSRYEDGFRKAAVAAVAAKAIPPLGRVLTDGALAYDWGWTVVQLIERAYGRERIVRIVRECADGDVLAFLDESAETLESRWRTWLVDGGLEEPSDEEETDGTARPGLVDGSASDPRGWTRPSETTV